VWLSFQLGLHIIAQQIDRFSPGVCRYENTRRARAGPCQSKQASFGEGDAWRQQAAKVADAFGTGSRVASGRNVPGIGRRGLPIHPTLGSLLFFVDDLVQKSYLFMLHGFMPILAPLPEPGRPTL
jgi:hypothetical protein